MMSSSKAKMTKKIPSYSSDDSHGTTLPSFFRSNFEILGKLGKGGYGAVYQCKYKLDEGIYAVKVVPFKSIDLDDTRQEAVMYAGLDHPSVARYYLAWVEEDRFLSGNSEYSGSSEDASGSPQDDSDELPYSTLYLLTELCHGDLNGLLFVKPHLEQADCWRIFREITEGLCYLHSKNIVHRDLSCQNIFLDMNRKVKIGDFGLAGYLKSDGFLERDAELGNKVYMAPEIKHSNRATLSSDIFSLGIIMYELFSSFDTESERLIKIMNLKEKKEEELKDWSSIHKSVLLSMLNDDPLARPTAEMVVANVEVLEGVKILKPEGELKSSTEVASEE